MRKWRRGFALTAGIVLPFPAYAADQPPPCYEITVLPSDPQAPGIALMVNKCTGDTWYLALLTELGAPGKASKFGYKWYPIGKATP